MSIKELEELRALVWAQLKVRRQLGGYNAEAESLIVLWESVAKIVDHIIDTDSAEVAVQIAEDKAKIAEDKARKK